MNKSNFKDLSIQDLEKESQLISPLVEAALSNYLVLAENISNSELHLLSQSLEDLTHDIVQSFFAVMNDEDSEKFEKLKKLHDQCLEFNQKSYKWSLTKPTPFERKRKLELSLCSRDWFQQHDRLYLSNQ